MKNDKEPLIYAVYIYNHGVTYHIYTAVYGPTMFKRIFAHFVNFFDKLLLD